jgi:hypothetical protein
MPKHIITISFEAHKPTPNDTQLFKNPHEMDIQRHPTIARNAQTHHHHLRCDLEWGSLLFRLRRKIEVLTSLQFYLRSKLVICISIQIHLRHKIDVSISIVAAAAIDVIVSHIVIAAGTTCAETILFAEIESIQVFPNAHLFNVCSDVL